MTENKLTDMSNLRKPLGDFIVHILREYDGDEISCTSR